MHYNAPVVTMRQAFVLPFGLTILLAGVLNSCANAEPRLQPPFSDIIPPCESTEAAQKRWFEQPDSRPLFNEWPIDAGAERACKGDDIKLWMRVYHFATEADAGLFAKTCDHIAEIDEHCYQEDDWPSFLGHAPDEAYSFILKEVELDPSVTWGIYFRVGRWVGHYEVEDRSAYWTDWYSTISPAQWGTVYTAIEQTIPHLRRQG